MNSGRRMIGLTQISNFRPRLCRLHADSTVGDRRTASNFSLATFSTVNVSFHAQPSSLPRQASSYLVFRRRAQHSAIRDVARNPIILPQIFRHRRSALSSFSRANLQTTDLESGQHHKASANFDSNLAKSASVASLLEYTLGLEGLSSAVASAASRADPLASMEVLQATLSMAMILLRDGPEGASSTSPSLLIDVL